MFKTIKRGHALPHRCRRRACMARAQGTWRVRREHGVRAGNMACAQGNEVICAYSAI
ncbi:hypothetical protein HMPREF1155_1722 [Slackia sp. CM382]|nr:hypothetical protein HMPREF1155_1722 [Slackia sp. CM382]